MKIEERLIELILSETDIDIRNNSRKRNVIEIRALYFKLLRDFNPALTLEQIAETVNKNHATVIHSLKRYDMYEKYNTELKQLNKIITSKINDENIMHLNDISSLKFELKKARNKIDNLELDLEECKLSAIEYKAEKYQFKIINQLEELMKQTAGTDKQDLIYLRLEAFYNMNKLKLN